MSHYRVALYEVRKEDGRVQAKIARRVDDGTPLEAHKIAPRLDTGMQRMLMGHAWARYVRISECGYGDDKCRQYENDTVVEPELVVKPT